MIPVEIFEIEVLLALIASACMFLIHDTENYIDIISALVATIMWWIAGLMTLTGIQSQSGTFAGSWLCWVFVGIGVVTALITFIKIIDILDRKNHVTMDFGGRL